MNETKEKTVPARKPSPGPAGLDGILIEGCAFTESVGKKELRPPLYSGRWSHSGRVNSSVFLAVPGGKVMVKPPKPQEINPGSDPRQVGVFIDCAPKGPAYTGPITPAMWQIINRWWQP